MKLMIGLLAAAIIGTGGFAFAAGLDDPQSARTVSLPGVSTSEHTTTAATTSDDDALGILPATTTNKLDTSGPCDEAEHANDPRCTGAVATDDDDNSGHDQGDDNRDDDDDNSGPGSGDDDDHGDRSGPNRGSDDDNDD